MGTALGEDPPRRLEHHDHGRLVVRAEDGATGVANDPLLVDHGLERPVRGNGVEMGAEEDRRSLTAPPGQAAEDVPHRRADDRSGPVLVPGEADVVELGDHPVGDGPLLPRRARDRAELEEQAENVAQRAASTATARPCPRPLEGGADEPAEERRRAASGVT